MLRSLCGMPSVVRTPHLCMLALGAAGGSGVPPTPFPPAAASSAACGGGWRGLLLAARSRTPGSARARARAPRLQPSARSSFLCQCLLPGAVACPKLGVLSTGPLALRQEDEFEEDAWAREYRDSCGPGGYGARVEDGLRADDPPSGASEPWLGIATRTPTRTAGSPSPSPHRREGRRGEREGAGATTSSLGNRCHSNGVALPGNATAGWRRPLPHHNWGREGKGVRCGETIPSLAGLGVPASARRGGGIEGKRLRGHELAPTWLQSSQQGS